MTESTRGVGGQQGNVGEEIDGHVDAGLDEVIADRIGLLTVEEKVRLLTAPNFTYLRSEPKIGLKPLAVSDGPSGVRGKNWDERDSSQNIPCHTALGATWDERMVERMSTIMARDARDKGVDIALTPCVNLQRSPYAGRYFEYFSEDPLLTGLLGGAYVRGLQKLGIAATVKHFVANDSETERMTVDVVVDERTLHELYLLPFELIVRNAKPWLVMSSYNLVNGRSMSESPLLRDVLKEEWGFDGLVMSDFLATPSTVAAAASGLDLAMPWPRINWDDRLVQAVRSGELAEATLDDKLARLMRLAMRCGALEGYPEKAPAPERDRAEEALCLRTAAASSFVLVRNADELLPLNRDMLKSVAVIGPNALQGRSNGSGSAKVYPVHVVSPLEGMADALGDRAQIRFAEGVRPYSRHPIARAPWLRQLDQAADGVMVDFLDQKGDVLASEGRNTGEFSWTGHFGHQIATAAVAWLRVRTNFVAQESGEHLVGVSGVGHYRLSLGGEQVFTGSIELPPGADITEGFTSPPQRMSSVRLEQGQAIELEIVHEVGTFKPGSPLSMFQIRMATPFASEDEEIAKAVAAARASDVAVVILGNDAEADSEGLDRKHLRLPGRQNELVTRVLEANPRTVVVVNSAAPVLLPWAEQVPSILLAWLPGQELGNALADVLFGDKEPGGRLPMTWPRDESGLHSVQPTDGRLHYVEGLFVGYRAYDRDGREPQYEFGHGLGYTTWEYQGIDIPSSAGTSADEVVVQVRVRNTGGRRGRETVQVYLSKPESAVERPARWLAGFALAAAEPGEEVTVQISLSMLSFRNRAADGWQVEPGRYVVEVGRSSRDLRLSEGIDLS